MRVVSRLRRLTFGKLSRFPAVTEILSAVIRRGTPRTKFLPYVCPQPTDFAPTDVRVVRRHGVSLALHPAHYFQWHHYFGLPDPVLEVLVREARRASVVIDVGANIGLYSLLMAKECRREVHAFEAASGTAAQLAWHCARNSIQNVFVNQLALGESTGQAALFDHGRGDSGKASLRVGAGADTEQVPVSTLDTYVDRLGLSGIDLLKIDVEGFECAVLRGGWNTVMRERPTICIELTPAWMTAADLNTLRSLVEQGYSINMIGQSTEAGYETLTDQAVLDRIVAVGTQCNVLLAPRTP